TGPAAVARGARPLVRFRPGHRVVPPLTTDGVGADENSPRRDDRATGARTHDHAKDNRGARACPVDSFRQRKAVGIVGELYFSPEQPDDVLAKRTAVQP